MYLIKKIATLFLVLAGLAACSGNACALAHNDKGENCFVLVVDPGHGGHDVGAAENGRQEKNINLAVAKALGELVRKNLKDVKVVMTRDDDSFLTLQQRAEKANKAKGDLFMSIHTNSVDKSNKNRATVCGTSVYTLGLHKDNNNMEVARRENSVIELESNYKQHYSGFDPSKDESYIIFEMAQKKNLHNSIRFASKAQQELVSHAGRRDRGVRQAGFWVLWATSMPSVLVELDFVCNPDQAEYLGSDKGVKELSESLFKAVKWYVETSNNVVGNITGGSLPAETPSEPKAEEVLTASVSGMGVAATRTVVSPPANNIANRQEYAQRRRRSAAGRQKSENRDVQVADIPLHKDVASSTLAASPPEEPKISAKEREKLEKQARKEAEKARKQALKKEEKARKEAEKLEKARNKESRAKKVQHFRTVYKIQILASKDILKQNNPRFQGLAPITMIHENNLYKYTYGECQTKQEVEALLKQVRKKIPDAFVIESTCQQ